MARCKDCIHEIVCSALIEKGLPWNDGEYPAEAFCMTFVNKADVVPKSEVDEIAEELSDTIVMKDELFDEVIKLRGELAKAKAEVARAFRKRMNEKMGKHTHLLGKEYVQRIMREVEKEYTEGDND